MASSGTYKQKMSKIILVFGATGAQGRHVVDSLLAPREDGSPSPYTVRALTRNPESQQALALREKGVELVKGKARRHHSPGPSGYAAEERFRG
jgi:uncharacterized protein YbjT (DUF2867 family)